MSEHLTRIIEYDISAIIGILMFGFMLFAIGLSCWLAHHDADWVNRLDQLPDDWSDGVGDEGDGGSGSGSGTEDEIDDISGDSK